MLIKYEVYLISIILFISLINTSLTYNNSFKWDEESLFNYIKYNYLVPDNETNTIKNFNYMIIDPNKYTKTTDIFEIKKNLDKLYKIYNLTSFIYIVNYLKKNTELNYNLKSFNNKIFSEIYKYKKNFDEYSTLSIIIQVEDDKMNLRLGSSCRYIISDLEALQILKDNSFYLTNKKINILLNRFISSFINKYAKNYQKYIKTGKNSFSFFRQILTFKGISILSIIIISYFILIYFCLIYKYKDKSNKNNTYIENNIEKFIKTNKDESLEF